MANASGDSVTELSATTGALVRVIRGSSYGFDEPKGITSDGNHIWVTNEGKGNSVTELSASTGALVKVISGSSYGFDSPQGITSGGNHVWVANYGYGGYSVTELSATTGALVKVITRLELWVRRTLWHHVGRQSHLGGELRLRRLLGYRALGLDRRPGEGHQRLELRVRRTQGHHVGWQPHLGGERGWRLGHRVLGLDRRPGEGHHAARATGSTVPGPLPRLATTSG